MYIKKSCAIILTQLSFLGVTSGARTHDIQNHNLTL